MNQSKFATAGKVHIVSTVNGQVIFELDPILPYRVDLRESGGKLYTLLWKVPYVARQLSWYRRFVSSIHS